QFLLLKDQLYRERGQQADVKLREVRDGRAREYLEPLRELEEIRRIHVEVAGVLKELKLKNLENKHDAEAMAAQQNYDSERILLADCIRHEIEEKLRKLEEDRNNLDLTSGKKKIPIFW